MFVYTSKLNYIIITLFIDFLLFLLNPSNENSTIHQLLHSFIFVSLLSHQFFLKNRILFRVV